MDTIRFDINKVVRKNISKLKPYSSARDEYADSGFPMIYLDANENPNENGVNRYPDPKQRNLKTILAAQKEVNTKNILLGNGSDEILDLLFRAFCEPQLDNIITLPPTYGMYNVLANINNIEDKGVLLTNKFQPNIQRIKEEINTRTKIIFLCSPNNPTGNSFDKESILQILEFFSGLVVIDEAYIDFSGKSSWITRLEEYPNLVITQTFSKAFGLAGIRLGVCYASEEIIEILNKIKPPYNVNQLTQQRALQRLTNLDDLKLEVNSILEEREKLILSIKEIEYVKEIYDSDANFILIKVDDANKRYNQLLKEGIVIRNRTTQPLCENTLRLTIGTANENRILITRMKKITDNPNGTLKQ